MAIVQISRIQQRRGLQQDLPQLASAEFGWSVDTRRLFIGNGTVEEGAPAAGITEILTQYSNILSVVQSYTYQGASAGYTVQTGSTALNPILRSLQSKIDDVVSTRDFGTIGNGVADDTASLQRAITQIYLSSLNPGQPLVRRVICIPAGTYKISSPLLIPPNCNLQGEGKNNTVILQVSTNQPVAIVCDSNYLTGSSAGANNSLLPSNISIEKLTFKQLLADTDVVVVESARSVRFSSVNFTGANAWIGGSSTSAGVKVLATVADTQQIQIEDSSIVNVASSANVFTGGTYSVTGVDFNNCYFATSYRGIVANAASTGTPSSIRVINSLFDNISHEAILGGNTVTGISSITNRYRNVGNGVNNSFGSDATPTTNIISYNAADCSSISDAFDRSDISSLSFARVSSNSSFSVLPHAGTQLGYAKISPGTRVALLDNQSSVSNVAALTSSLSGAIGRGEIDYSLTRGTASRYGSLKFTVNGSTYSYDEEYNETGITGVTLQVASGALQYTSTSTGAAPVITYSIRWLT